MDNLIDTILKEIKAKNFDSGHDYRNEIYDKLTEIGESYTLSKKDLLIDLDSKNNEVESYIIFSFDNYINIYTDTHEDDGANITIDSVVLGGLTIDLLDWQEKKVIDYIDNILIFS